MENITKIEIIMEVARKNSRMRLWLFLILYLVVTPLQAQEKKDSVNSKRINNLFSISVETSVKDSAQLVKYRTKFHNHWNGLQIGTIHFANLPKAWEILELNCCKSIAFQYNFGQLNIFTSKNKAFGCFTGLGLEYQRLCFDNNYISITNENGELQIIDLNEEIESLTKVKRSTLKNLYLTVPILIEVQKKKFFAMAGIAGGLRLHSKTKVVYKNENNNKKKIKNSGNFDMSPIKMDAIARIGYSGFNIWCSYTLTDMFKSIDIHPVSIGIGLNF